MELPNGNTNVIESELESLYLDTGIRILEERTIAGDPEARRALENLAQELRAFEDA